MSQNKVVVVELDTYTQVKTLGRYFVATLFSSLDLLEWNIYLKGKYIRFTIKKKQMLRTIGHRLAVSKVADQKGQSDLTLSSSLSFLFSCFSLKGMRSAVSL